MPPSVAPRHRLVRRPRHQPCHRASGRGRRQPTRIAVLVSILSLLGTWLILGPGGAASSAPSVLARDSFDRSVGSGLGAADLGGSYVLGYSGANPFAVSDGAAQVALTGGSVSASLMQVQATDVDVSVVAGLGEIPDQRFGVFHSVEGRKLADRSAYRGRVIIRERGRMTVSLSRKRGSRDVGLGERPLSATVATGSQVRLEMQVSGSNPVSVRVRAWVDGTPEPGWQLTVVDDSADRIVGPGGVGYLDYLSGASVPAHLAVTSFAADSLPVDPADTGESTATPSSVPSTPSGSAATTASTAASTTPTSPTSPTPTSSAPSTTSPSSSGAAPTPTVSSTSTPAPPTPASMSADRGSLPIGAASYPVPAGALFVSSLSGDDAASGSVSAPKRTVTAALRAAHSGQTIVLRAGTYHESVFVTPDKAGVTVQNYPGEAVWFDGSRAVDRWEGAGSTWTAGGWTAEFDHWTSFTRGLNQKSFLTPAFPMAAWPDQLYVDGSQLRQVGSVAEVSPGTFFVDYATDRLTMGTNPDGHEVRAADLDRAITVAAPDVTLRGFGVRRYANSLSTGGAIYLARPGDTAQNLVLQDLATQGISMYKANVWLDHVTILRAGMVGASGHLADGARVTNSIISQTNTEHFNKAPASAAIKITRSRHILVSNNYLSDNYDTHGMWIDISVVDFKIVGNTVQNNGRAPNIQVELSDTGIVADNIVRGGDDGVYIYDAGNVKVYNNTFGGNSRGSVYLSQDDRRADAAGLGDPACPWIVRNITISNNVFQYNGGDYGLQIRALDGSTHISASQMNITIDGNVFHEPSEHTDMMVAWGGDDNHSLTRLSSPSALNAFLNKNWVNFQDPRGVAARVDGRLGVPLPADIATAIGQPAGTRHIGAF